MHESMPYCCLLLYLMDTFCCLWLGLMDTFCCLWLGLMEITSPFINNKWFLDKMGLGTACGMGEGHGD